MALALLLAFAAPAAAQETETATAQETMPEIGHDPARLPEPVRATRERILEAARSGDVEEMRAVIEMNEMPPSFGFGGSEDPIALWKEASGDGEGLEVLAILIEILEAGYAHLDPGGAQEMYVWPYFHAVPLDGLTPQQEVELYQIVSPDQRAQMEEFGSYLHYRIGIGPDGTWHYFVAGD